MSYQTIGNGGSCHTFLSQRFVSVITDEKKHVFNVGIKNPL